MKAFNEEKFFSLMWLNLQLFFIYDLEFLCMT